MNLLFILILEDLRFEIIIIKHFNLIFCCCIAIPGALETEGLFDQERQGAGGSNNNNEMLVGYHRAMKMNEPQIHRKHNNKIMLNKRIYTRTSLAVQWFRLHTFTTGVLVQSLVGELRSHKLQHGQIYIYTMIPCIESSKTHKATLLRYQEKQGCNCHKSHYLLLHYLWNRQVEGNYDEKRTQDYIPRYWWCSTSCFL